MLYKQKTVRHAESIANVEFVNHIICMVNSPLGCHSWPEHEVRLSKCCN